VFAGGIGEHDPQTRADITHGLAPLGVNIDPTLNHAAVSGIQPISSPESATAVLVVPAREDQMIAVHVERMARHVTQV
jgi:acetate kinase